LVHNVPCAHLAAVADTDLVSAQRCAAEINVARAWADYHALLDDTTIDAVVICSSTDTHARIIEDAAAAGKHIFCEKPIDLDLVRIDRALAAVERAGVVLQVGFNRRFDPSFKKVRDVVSSGEIGVPEIVRITSRDPSPPSIDYVRVSGGLFLDMTIHDFDTARFLVGQEVEEIYAVGGVMVDPAIGLEGDIDTAVVTLRFAGGALCVIDNSRRAVYGYDQRVEVFGSGGSASADNCYPTSAVVSDAHSVRRDLPLNFFLERYTPSYIAEMRAFVDCVRIGGVPPVGGDDGRAATALGIAAAESLRRDRPVRLAGLGP
jgi:myo-inositol 2-dehydrogenase/D-chiro-inositol 1-dehydrogenase